MKPASFIEIITVLFIALGQTFTAFGQEAIIYRTDKFKKDIKRVVDSKQELIAFGLGPQISVRVDTIRETLYWYDNNTRKIQRANYNGSDVEDLVTSGLKAVESMAIDVNGRKIYWIDRNSFKIQRSNLDGTDIEDLFIYEYGINPRQLTPDFEQGKIYWLIRTLEEFKILRANLDGSNVEEIVNGIKNIRDFVLDADNSKIYYIGDHNNKIQRINLDGSNLETLLTITEGPRNFYYMFLDKKREKIYWNNHRYLYQANFDGSNIEELFYIGISSIKEPIFDSNQGLLYWAAGNSIVRSDLTGNKQSILSGLDGARGLSIDLRNNQMFWIEDPGEIHGANINGSNANIKIPTGLYSPEAIALDLQNNQIYWSDGGVIPYREPRIQRANLDGSAVEDVLISEIAKYIKLDINNGKIYWSTSDDNIKRANLDGSNIEVIINEGYPSGIALDISAEKIYWVDWLRNKIRRANLNGTDIEDILSSNDGISTISDLTLDITEKIIYWIDREAIKSASFNGNNIRNHICPKRLKKKPV